VDLHVVLVEPEIPQNTGNIARTCAAVGATLHLVEPLGFSLSDKYLKRAGLDYWDQVIVETHQDLENFLHGQGVTGWGSIGGGEECKETNEANLVFVTKKATSVYTDFSYPDPCFLLFGKETEGLPERLLKKHLHRCVRIPMRAGARSLNLSNAAAIIVYEVLRQSGFGGLRLEGSFN
jgi:tRNA (cytidine/uridine-2'-O-)-methyltransferase